MYGKILEHQQTAGVIKLVFGSMLTMMPALSYGCLQSYFTIGVPKLMKPNQTGILLDLHQMYLISRVLCIWIIPSTGPNDIICSFPESIEWSDWRIPLWIDGRQVWKKEESDSIQHSSDPVSLLCLLLPLLLEPCCCLRNIKSFLQHCPGRDLQY